MCDICHGPGLTLTRQLSAIKVPLSIRSYGDRLIQREVTQLKATIRVSPVAITAVLAIGIAAQPLSFNYTNPSASMRMARWLEMGMETAEAMEMAAAKGMEAGTVGVMEASMATAVRARVQAPETEVVTAMSTGQRPQRLER
jgi:hypothetical protein